MARYRLLSDWVAAGPSPVVLKAGTVVGDDTPYPISNEMQKKINKNTMVETKDNPWAEKPATQEAKAEGDLQRVEEEEPKKVEPPKKPVAPAGGRVDNPKPPEKPNENLYPKG